MFSGYKTYAVAACIAAITVVHSLGYIDEATRDTLLGLFVGGGLATLRAGVGK